MFNLAIDSRFGKDRHRIAETQRRLGAQPRACLAGHADKHSSSPLEQLLNKRSGRHHQIDLNAYSTRRISA
jgi:hypothetical protein